MKAGMVIILLLISGICFCQPFDTTRYTIQVKFANETDQYFKTDLAWRGADGASSVVLGNGKILWLFSDSFISADSTRSRKGSKIIRNSIGIQEGSDLKTAPIKYYWDKSGKEPQAFFHTPGNFWFWTGHGVMIKDQLLIFLMKVREVKTGLGFESFGWSAVLISNPADEPSKWKMKYLEGQETYGLIVGSAAVLKDEKYLYAYGAVEPSTHEIYVLRWKIDLANSGDLSNPEWFNNGKWATRITRNPVPEPLFIGATEFSVHYDPSLKKFIQIQSFGFGEASIGIRMADSLQGKWTEPFLFYKPGYPGIQKPFMYTAKAHPELQSDGIYITYNVNSFDFGELIENQNLYFPKFILIKIIDKKKPAFAMSNVTFRRSVLAFAMSECAEMRSECAEGMSKLEESMPDHEKD